MDTDNDTGDALVNMDSLLSLLEEEINDRERMNYLYGKNLEKKHDSNFPMQKR